MIWKQSRKKKTIETRSQKFLLYAYGTHQRINRARSLETQTLGNGMILERNHKKSNMERCCAYTVVDLLNVNLSKLTNMVDSLQIRFFSYLDVIALFIMHEVNCIKTPGHVILRNPLIRVLTPLYWHLNNLCCSAKITLKPLKVIVVLGWPGPHVTSPTNSVESRQVRAMVTIPRGCCCYLMVLDTTWLHSHWSVAKNP